MAKFHISETIYSEKVKTVRLGTTAQNYGNTEIGKAVKLSASDAYALCVAGDRIEAIVSSSNLASQGKVDGFAIGGIVGTGYKSVVFDGLQATPGTGVIGYGDYVVVGTVSPFGTALPTNLKVTKATDQAAASAGVYRARVVSLGVSASGAVGTAGVIEFV